MPNKEDYAIVIGIDSYPALRPLKAAVRDSARFLEWLLSPVGGDVPVDNIRHIKSGAIAAADPMDAQPLQGEVDRALRDFGVVAGKRIGRRVYFYFAGHGLGANFDDVGMLMANATPGTLRSNIGLDGYLSLIHERGFFDESVFILDCCRDPELSVGTGRPPFTFPPPPPNPRQLEDMVILAAEFGAKAFERQQQTANGFEPRGVLTDALITGLNGEAAAADGSITSSSLRQFLIDRVPQMAGDPRLVQRPRIDRVPTREIVFRPASRPTPLSVRIISPPGLAGEFVLTDAQANEVARRTAADAEESKPPWDLELFKDSRYTLVHTASTLETILDTRKLSGPPYVYRVPVPQ